MQNPSSAAVGQIVGEVVARVRTCYGDRLRSVLVRYPAPGVHPEEEWDMQFFAVLEGEFERFEELVTLAGIASEVGIEHNLAISMHPLTLEQVEDPDLMGPFFSANLQEAVRVG